MASVPTARYADWSHFRPNLCNETALRNDLSLELHFLANFRVRGTVVQSVAGLRASNDSPRPAPAQHATPRCTAPDVAACSVAA